MASEEEVQFFLEGFRAKLEVWGILFLNRVKNLQALADLEIRPVEREEFIRGLLVSDFSEGPIKDLVNGGPEMWIFGLFIKEQDVYVKVTMGRTNAQTICISFHLAEHPISYAFK